MTSDETLDETATEAERAAEEAPFVDAETFGVDATEGAAATRGTAEAFGGAADEGRRHPLEHVAGNGAPEQGFPLSGHLGAMGVYVGGVSLLAVAARLTGRTIQPPTPWDVVVGAAATDQLSRLVARDPGAGPLRAPSTRLEGTNGPAKLKGRVRDKGAKRTVGELLTCPFYNGMWVVTGLSAGYVFAPRATRLAASGMAALTGSDFLHFARAKLT